MADINLTLILLIIVILLIAFIGSKIIRKNGGQHINKVLDVIYKPQSTDRTTYRDEDPLFNSLVRYFKSNNLASLILKNLNRSGTLTLEKIKESVDREIEKTLDVSTYWKVITVLCNANFICVRELKFEITELGKELLSLKPK